MINILASEMAGMIISSLPDEQEKRVGMAGVPERSVDAWL
jgi:hypothetical protein